MLEELKQSVCAANRALAEKGLSLLNRGCVSAIDRDSQTVFVRPASKALSGLELDDIVAVRIEGDRYRMEGAAQPMAELDTHLEIYKAFPQIHSLATTQSKWVTLWAQCGNSIPPLGVIHADNFYGEIRCTKPLSQFEYSADYQANLGRNAAETIAQREVFPSGAILLRYHGSLCWDSDPMAVVETAATLETVAELAWYTQGKSLTYLPFALTNQRFFSHHPECKALEYAYGSNEWIEGYGSKDELPDEDEMD